MLLSPPTLDETRAEMRVTVNGDVLSTNVDQLQEELERMIQSRSALRWFVMDFVGTRMLDSAGLNLLVWTVRAVEEKGGKVRAIVHNTNVQRTFLFTRLDRYLDLVVDTAK